MKHLGDITKISGYTAPIVDCIIGGSPCQDLSVAGKRAGLDGERSGLYIEQVRIVKEMRNRDERNGRTDNDIRPRYMVWENVPGAFSSNKGDDFRIVLEEIAKVKDENAVIPMPKDGKWTSSGCIVADGWSVAWRVLDAQFWGVPQRRRRIALVADFGGQSAPEILFVRESVSGHLDEGKQKRKATTSDAQGSFGADDCIGVDIYNTTLTGDKACPLTAEGHTSTGTCPKVMTPLWENKSVANCLNTNDMSEAYVNEIIVMAARPVYALDRASFNQGKNAQFDFEVSDKGINSPLVAKGPGAVCYSFDPTASRDAGDYILDGVSNPLINGTCPRHKRAVCYAINGDKAGTLDASHYKGCGERGGVEREVIAVPAKTIYIVRRLTPLECERLQGYPDGWTDIGEWTDSSGKKRQTSDAARYKALGNSIALSPWKWVLKRISACYERDATMASLFDGIGGFPYLWEQLNGKGSCLWASEIEEFPMAVTKVRIGGS